MSQEENSYDPARYDRPSVTTDIVIFTLRQKKLHVLLVLRRSWPFDGQWAIPGGFVRMKETLEEGARRELEEETGVADVFLEQLHAFGTPDRDPRTRVITVAYMALIPSDRLTLRADTDAADVGWFPADALPQPLAFDHDHILAVALQALRRRLESGNIARELLPPRFTLTELQEVYEILLEQTLDKRNFRKWILSLGLVMPTDQAQRGKHRPALLYEFAPDTAGERRFLWNRRLQRRPAS